MSKDTIIIIAAAAFGLWVISKVVAKPKASIAAGEPSPSVTGAERANGLPNGDFINEFYNAYGINV